MNHGVGPGEHVQIEVVQFRVGVKVRVRVRVMNLTADELHSEDKHRIRGYVVLPATAVGNLQG